MATIEERIEQIRNDREHGARWLVRETILLLRDLAQSMIDAHSSPEEQQQRLLTVGRTLAQARPAMAALASAVGRILNTGDPADIVQTATALLQDYDSSTSRIAQAAQPLLTGRLMTCSISGTVLDVLLQCRVNVTEVIVLEGRPRYEGRAMAQGLASKGISVTLITDAQAAIFLPLCHAVVVGADSILADGSVLNKAGTSLLAWAAHGYNVPFYVLSETLKISPHHWHQDEMAHWHENTAMLEEKEAAEVLAQPIEQVRVRNFYFDHTPTQLVTGIITERGMLNQQEIAAIARQALTNEQAFMKDKT